MKYRWKANNCRFKMNIHKSKYMFYYYSSSFQKITVTSKFCKFFIFYLESSLLRSYNLVMNNNSIIME